MVENSFQSQKLYEKKQFFFLDRYFLSVPALEALNKLITEDDNLLQIVTNAKKSCTDYGKADKYIGRGRPRKKEASIKLKTYFESKKNGVYSI